MRTLEEIQEDPLVAWEEWQADVDKIQELEDEVKIQEDTLAKIKSTAFDWMEGAGMPEFKNYEWIVNQVGDR